VFVMRVSSASMLALVVSWETIQQRDSLGSYLLLSYCGQCLGFSSRPLALSSPDLRVGSV